MSVRTAKAGTKTRALKGPKSARSGRRKTAARRTPVVRRPARSTVIPPALIIPTLSRHMLVDGFDIVVDLRKSRGTHLVDARTGRRYLDFFTFVASSPLGMNHPALTAADFRKKLGYVAVTKPSLSDIYTEEQAQFVDTFSRLAMPATLPHAFFIEGGALAVENTLKAAFDWKIRKNRAQGYREERGRQIIHFRQAFHGRSGYTLSLTNTDPVKTDLFPKFAWPRVLNPAVRFPLNEENLARVIADEETSLGQIKQAFHENRDDIAAIIIEAIQGEGGDNHFRGEFFRALREVADENDAMLIFDEVQTGVGMTGKMWAHQHFVEPDMIAFGKKMQVCGFLCGRKIEEVPENVFKVSSRLNSTWGGNLVDMVRAQKFLEVIEKERLVENARIQGERLLGALHRLAEEFPAVSNPRGLGLFAAFDMPDGETRGKVRLACMEKGLIILPSGERSIRFRPPLNVSASEIDEGIGIVAESLREL
ncbi:MAG TPA: L-lysine 6-transaminase [Bacteroidota bacterium]|nr:L-lysine 6-transaminase [Bacteroidota bacterium]